jgi:hypothetical protein
MPNISLPTRREFLEQLAPYPVECCSTIDEDASTCIICVRELVDVPVNDETERAVLLHDTHAFGEECAREWLASANTCPKCRTVLYQQDGGDDDHDDIDDADIDDAESIEPTFDAEELAHLMWQVSELSRRDPRTEAFSDHEVMALYWDLWNQWIMAIDEDVNGTWLINGPRSTEVAGALRELLQVRYRWWRHSSEQLNVNITRGVYYPAGSWNLTERDLRRRVVIGSGLSLDLQSNVDLMVLTDYVLEKAFNGGSTTCVRVAGHPAAVALHDRINGVLQSFRGQKITVFALREKLRESVGDADQMERDGANPNLPPGYTHFLRRLIDKITRRAIRRSKEARMIRRALRNRPVSRAPRMSVPAWNPY